MRYLVSGGTGMIGRGLATALLEEDHDVVVLSRNPDLHREDMPAGVKLAQWDARTVGAWAEWVERADAVVHLAGARLAGPDPRLRWTKRRKRIICESRREAGRAITAAIEGAGRKPAALIQASGVDYYPSGEPLVTEETPPGEGFLSWVCTECWENPTAPVERMGVRRVVVRSGPMLNGDDGFLPPQVLQTRLFAGGAIGSGRQWVSWVHYQDVISAIRFLAQNPDAGGAYNLVAPNPVRHEQLARALGQVLNRPIFMRWPSFLFEVAFGEMAVTLLKGVRASAERLQQAGFEFQFPEIEGALRDLLR
jgi:uncharacterized protein (TIGR01777 family)